MEVTMISRGVEISIARGVAETEDVVSYSTSTVSYILLLGGHLKLGDTHIW